MSLIPYSSQDRNSPAPQDLVLGSKEHRIVLRTNALVVLQDTSTNELVLIDDITNHNALVVDGNNIPEDPVCPHCGGDLRGLKNSGSGEGQRQRRSNGVHGEKDTNIVDEDAFIHDRYFKLLDITAKNQLPASLFSPNYTQTFFTTLKLLGRGARGSVYLVQHNLHSHQLGQFALKKITVGDDPQILDRVLAEVEVLVQLSCKATYLVRYFHVWLELDQPAFGPQVPCAFILQQYCSGGNLEDFVEWLQNPPLTVKQMKKHKIRHLEGRLLNLEEVVAIIKDIVSGVQELHSSHVIHRDLKPSNCLISAEFEFPDFPSLEISKPLPRVLIGDFGESQLEGSKRHATGATGTLEYCAPELFELKEFSKASDVYSLGMILYFLTFGKLPFKSRGFEIDGLRAEVEQFNHSIGKRKGFEAIIDLINDMTKREPEDRIGLDEVIDRLDAIKVHENTNHTSIPVFEKGLEEVVEKKTNVYKSVGILSIQLALVSILLKADVSQLLKYLFLFFIGLSWKTAWSSSVAVALFITVALSLVV